MSIQNVPLESQDLTDEELAKLVIKNYGYKLKYCTEWKSWILYEGRIWKKVDTPVTFNFVWRIVDSIKAAICEKQKNTKTGANVDASQTLTQKLKAVVKLGNVRPAENIMRAAQGMNPVSITEFDTDPYILNCPNGILDLKTMQLKPHDPSQLLTKTTGAAYIGKYHSSLWLDTVASIFPNEETRNYVQKVLGYTLCGGNKEELAFFLFGTGGNGKGVIMGTVIQTLGDYAVVIPSDTLVTAGNYGEDGSGVSPHIAALRGARLASASETNNGRTLNASVLKQLTDQGKVLYARGIRQDPIQFIATHVLFLESNYPPAITDVRDNGLTRRIMIIPFKQTFSAEQGNRNNDLKELLATQEAKEDVLTWLVEGYRKYTQEGLKPPMEVIEANRGYYDDNDIVGHFIESKCVLGSGSDYKITKGMLYSDFLQFYRNECGQYPMSARAFNQIIAKMPGIIEKKIHGVRYWAGIMRNKTPILDPKVDK